MSRKTLFLVISISFITSFLSCSDKEYVSPIADMVIGNKEFEADEDSCFIYGGISSFNDVICKSTEKWCQVTTLDNTIKIYVSYNESIKDREATITLEDPFDDSSLMFKVRQKLNYGSLRKSLKIEKFKLICNGKEFKPFLLSENEIHVNMTKTDVLNPMSIEMSHNADSAYIDDYLFNHEDVWNFSDFTKPHNVRLISAKGAENTWEIKIYDLPVLVLNTPDAQPIDSKKVRKEGCFMMLIDSSGKIDTLGTAGVKGRGNTTWKQPKKPYNVKLDKKKSILGMAKSKHWVLLSNPFYDRTQLHNDVAFEIARLTDYKWVQSGKFVELILNGQHQGLYYLCEKIRIESGKIDIAGITPVDTVGDALTGGYLLESDNGPHHDKTSFTTDYFNMTGINFETLKEYVVPLYWLFSKPEDEIPSAQYTYISSYMNHLESLITSDSTLYSGEYRKYLDIESVVNWWVVENLCMNEEASRSKNILLYKDRDSSAGGGKLAVGPPWDFDYGSFGDFTKFNILFAYDYTWCYKRLLKDPFVIKRLKEKWSKYYILWKDYIPGYIDQQFKLIHKSALRNEKMWPNWLVSSNTYEYHVEEMKKVFISQLNWMNDYIVNLEYE